MYRDLFGDPEKIEYHGREWWIQELCRWDGSVKAVNLFNGAGEFLGEFQSREDALDAIHTENYPVRGPQMRRKGFDLK